MSRRVGVGGVFEVTTARPHVLCNCWCDHSELVSRDRAVTLLRLSQDTQDTAWRHSQTQSYSDDLWNFWYAIILEAFV